MKGRGGEEEGNGSKKDQGVLGGKVGGIGEKWEIVVILGSFRREFLVGRGEGFFLSTGVGFGKGVRGIEIHGIHIEGRMES